MMVLGLVFFNGLSGMLCTDAGIKKAFDDYLWILLFSVPLLVSILTFVEFLPPAGLPGYCTAINIMANVVNIVMDYVYIRVFGMDVLVRIYDENVEIDFRSLGPSIDVMEEEEKEMEINTRMLRAVVSKIETEYIMGMNATRITIAK